MTHTTPFIPFFCSARARALSRVGSRTFFLIILRTVFCALFLVSLRNTALAQRDTLLLCDNRFDTLRQPPLSLIDALLHKIAHKRSGSGSTWLISVKECRFGNIGDLTGQGKEAKFLDDGDPAIRNCLFFSADAWLSIGNGQFEKFCAIKRTLASPGDYGLDHHDQTLKKALHQLVDSMYRKAPESPAIDGLVWNEEQIRADNVTKGWANYPINKAASSPSGSPVDSTLPPDSVSSPYISSSSYRSPLPDSADGIFTSFGDFEYNRLQPHHFSLMADRDGICTFHWRDTFPPKKMPPPIWGLLYGGKYYIKITETQFLPLERNNSTFYFYIPYSLPNMYELTYHAPPPGFNQGPSGFDNAPAVDSWAGLIVVVTFGLVGEIIKSSRKPPPAPGKTIFPDDRNDLRHCFLDMESGDIIYAKSPLCHL